MVRLMKQSAQFQQIENRTSVSLFFIFFCFISLLTISSCKDSGELLVYYKIGFVESPISITNEDFAKEAEQHHTDTVIRIPKERFDKFCDMLSGLHGVYNSENWHDYRINIKYKDTDIAIQLPAPDSLNDKIVAYIGDKKKVYISDAILYEILCSARYFDFFDKEDLNYIPLLKKYKTPTDYTYYFKNQDSIPAKVRSRYKVALECK